jgi:hypothetical protein
MIRPNPSQHVQIFPRDRWSVAGLGRWEAELSRDQAAVAQQGVTEQFMVMSLGSFMGYPLVMAVP